MKDSGIYDQKIQLQMIVAIKFVNWENMNSLLDNVYNKQFGFKFSDKKYLELIITSGIIIPYSYTNDKRTNPSGSKWSILPRPK